MVRYNPCRKAYIMHKAPLQDKIYLGICLLFCLYVLVSVFTHTIEIKVKGNTVVEAQEIQQPIIKEVKAPDERVTKLRTFLESKNSPMAKYAELIVEEADANDIGWTWITGISCMESACGLKLPQGSHNAWGLGGSKFMYFKSWEESIKYMSKLLGTNYRHNILQGIKTNYCPASDGCRSNWSAIVAQASKEIAGI